MKHAWKAAALASLLMTSNAHGQIWVGQIAGEAVRSASNFESLCRTGAMIAHTSDRQMASLQEGVQGAMRLYIELAGAAQPADVTAAFERRQASWFLAADGLSITNLTAIADPLAARHGALGEPAQFVRAGDGRTATGVWPVTDAESGQVLGYYRGVFRRSGGRWRLLSLEVGEGPEAPPHATPYCHAPGDVDAYNAERAALVTPKDNADLPPASEDTQPADAVAPQ